MGDSSRIAIPNRCLQLGVPGVWRTSASGALFVPFECLGQTAEFVQQGPVVAVEEAECAAQVAHVNARSDEEFEASDAHDFDKGQLFERHAAAPHPALFNGLVVQHDATALNVKNHERQHGPDHGTEGALA